MALNRRPATRSRRGVAVLVTTLVLGGLSAATPARAQTSPPFPMGPACAVPPTAPENDTWPVAVPDSLGSTAGAVTFQGAMLLSNDRGTTAVSLVGVASMSSGGGSITGTGPYTYTPAPLFTGTDVFTYEISDAGGETTVGIVTVTVTPDVVPPTVAVPAVVGQPQAAAVAAITGAALIAGTTNANSTTVGIGIVISQNPAAGVNVAPGSSVALVVSVGALVPNVVGSTQAAATTAITAAGLTVGTVTATNSGTPAGIILSQALPAGTSVAPGTAMALTVSLGPANVVVPDVVNQTAAAADASIVAAGLTLGTRTTANSSTVGIGIVISQSPAAGVNVAPGSSVALVVSVGALVPNVVGSTQAAATTALTAAGLAVGAVTATNSGTPAGIILSQALPAGTSVAPGTAMALTVSLGPANVLVPDVVNQTAAAADASIAAAGLTLGTRTTASSTTVAAGSVISTSPVAGASVPPGSAVALVVSLGLPTPVGLVAAFGFDEVNGTTAINSVNAAFPGTIRQAIRVAGKIGSALSFDGVNDWVTVTDITASPLDLTTGMTVEAWVNPTAMAGWETVVMKERGSLGTGLLSYALYAHDGAPEAGGFAGPAGYLRPAPAFTTTDQGVRQASHTPVPLGVWTHLATTYDGANMRLYINGVLVATKAQTGSIAAGNQPLRIGGNNVSGEFLQGLIDEVRIYNRALSAAEVAADMTTPIVR